MKKILYYGFLFLGIISISIYLVYNYFNIYTLDTKKVTNQIKESVLNMLELESIGFEVELKQNFLEKENVFHVENGSGKLVNNILYKKMVSPYNDFTVVNEFYQIYNDGKITTYNKYNDEDFLKSEIEVDRRTNLNEALLYINFQKLNDIKVLNKYQRNDKKIEIEVSKGIAYSCMELEDEKTKALITLSNGFITGIDLDIDTCTKEVLSDFKFSVKYKHFNALEQIDIPKSVVQVK